MSSSPEIRDQVEALAAYGKPHKEIARVLRIDLEALRTDYEEELATGRMKPNSRVAEALYRTGIARGPRRRLLREFAVQPLHFASRSSRRRSA